ncbi:MAG: transcription antitermination factor NusB [Bowdeniella nasicola]|nr:transcription antitermination factor NusB [Bowdeniella nasicola]
MRLTDARRVALNTLLAIDLDGAYANLALPKELRAAQLEPRDAAFATELVYGTTRLAGRYDAIIRIVTGERSVGSFDPEVRAILRTGCHEILTLETPAHAVVSQAVSAAREYVGERATGFVNGVLRSVARRPLAEWRAEVSGGRDGLGHWHSHPAWLVKELTAALAAHGRSIEELPDLLAANNRPPLIDLVIRRGDRGALLHELPLEVEPTELSPIGMRLLRGNPARIREVRSGRLAVQDEGSQIMALIAAGAPIEGRDERWLDLCAGPGGKAGVLAARAEKVGAHLVANEVSRHRADLVARTLRDFDSVEIRCADGRRVAEDEPGAYDRVLVDAPCTGTGALRRRPDSRWRHSRSDLDDLTALQRDLLAAAAGALRPGGILTYVTCSPLQRETLAQVRFAAKTLGLTVLDTPAIAEHVLGRVIPEVGDTTSVQLWPHVHGTDAMFGVAFRR